MPQNLNKFLKDRKYFWPCLEPPARTRAAIEQLGAEMVAACEAWTPPAGQAEELELIRRAGIRCWSKSLLRHGEAANAYELTAIFNSETVKTYPSGTKGTRTLNHHIAERHAPNVVTLRKVSKVLGRPAHSELCPLLWASLDLSIDVRDLGPALIASTIGLGSMPLQRALGILIPDTGDPDGWLLPPPLHLRGLARLENLGALILLLRLSRLYGCEDEVRFSLASSLREWLVVLGIELHERGIAADVLGMCVTRIFPSVEVPSTTTARELAQMSAGLNVASLDGRAEDAEWNWSDRLEAMTTYIVDFERSVLAGAVERYKESQGLQEN